MTPADEIVWHYRDKGLSGWKLVRAVARHARLLELNDGEIAEELWDRRLAGEKEKGGP